VKHGGQIVVAYISTSLTAYDTTESCIAGMVD